MSSRLGRLSGALLLETLEDGRKAYYLIGDTKRPCDWQAAGFTAPAARDPQHMPWIKLQSSGEPQLRGPVLILELTGEAAAREVAARLLVQRNGSVSERLWRLILGVEEDAPELHSDHEVEARWLTETPKRVFEIVRDNVLKCT